MYVIMSIKDKERTMVATFALHASVMLSQGRNEDPGSLRQVFGFSLCERLEQTRGRHWPRFGLKRVEMRPSPFATLIVNACVRRLGSRAGPRTGKEETGFRKEEGQRGQRAKGGGGWGGHGQFAAPPSDWGGSHRAGGGGGGGWRQKILQGGKGWVRGKEARSGSACSRRFSAGSRGEFLGVQSMDFSHFHPNVAKGSCGLCLSG